MIVRLTFRRPPRGPKGLQVAALTDGNLIVIGPELGPLELPVDLRDHGWRVRVLSPNREPEPLLDAWHAELCDARRAAALWVARSRHGQNVRRFHHRQLSRGRTSCPPSDSST